MSDEPQQVKRGFLQDADGNSSSKRMESLVCLGVAILVTGIGLILNRDVSNVVLSFLGAACAFQGVSAVQDGFGINRRF